MAPKGFMDMPNWRSGCNPLPKNEIVTQTSKRENLPPTPSPSPPLHLSNKNWRINACSNFSAPLPTKKVLSHHSIRVGQVLHLDEEETVPQGSIIHQYLKNDPDSNPYDHFVVVVGIEEPKGNRPAIITFRGVTSFNGVRVEEAKGQKGKGDHVRFFVKVENSEDSSPIDHYLGIKGVVRVEAKSGKLPKRSYVNLSPNSVFKIEIEHLSELRAPLRKIFFEPNDIRWMNEQAEQIEEKERRRSKSPSKSPSTTPRNFSPEGPWRRTPSPPFSN